MEGSKGGVPKQRQHMVLSMQIVAAPAAAAVAATVCANLQKATGFVCATPKTIILLSFNSETRVV